MAQCCFSQGCELKVQFVCQCLNSVTYSCEFHLQLHIKIPIKAHSLGPVLRKPSELNQDGILKFLTKEKAKKEKLRTIAFTSCDQNPNNTENTIKISLNDLNSDLEEISCLIEKIFQISVGDPLLNSSILQHDIEIKEALLQDDSEKNNRVNLFCLLNQLGNKRSEILSKANNEPKTEQDFKKTCSLYENASNSLIRKFYQKLIKGYQKITSTYLISKEANLYIYNTETEKEELKVLEPKAKFTSFSFSVHLPNGELFCFGRYISFAIILDKNYKIKKQLLGVSKNCYGAVYSNRSVYCFWGNNYPVRKFDLDQNRWTNLACMKAYIGNHFYSVAFNRNILISIDFNTEILLYSIDLDSFSEIPYSFEEIVKILITAEERLYLIECFESGNIYESEVNNEYNWKRVTKSKIEYAPDQVYCSYNKGGIYISVLCSGYRAYFKFDLNRKKLIDISCYSENFGLKRSGDNLKVIKRYKNTFILNPNHAAIYIDKGYTLFNIVDNLENIELNNREINSHRKNSSLYGIAWDHKGYSLMHLGRYLEAIDCYNELINTFTNSSGKPITIDDLSIRGKRDLANLYINKGIALVELGKPLEAIEYYNQANKLSKFVESKVYFLKGNAFENANRHAEAIKCYEKVIILNAGWSEYYWAELYNSIGISCQNLEKNLEAIEYYNKAIENYHNYPDAFNNKGNALLKIGKYVEAIECYNEAINLDPDYPYYYLNKASTLSYLGKTLEAIGCYNKATIIKSNGVRAYNKRNSLMHLKEFM